MHIDLGKTQNLSTISAIFKTQLDIEPHYIVSDIDMLTKIMNDGNLWIVQNDGEIMGSFVYRISESNCEIVMMASSTPRNGVGSQVIAHFEDVCRQQNISKLRCWSLVDHQAQGFYDKMGFTEQYLMKQQFDGLDCWFFGKILV